MTGVVELRASSSVEREQWMDFWDAAGREPFGHPGYVELFCGPEDQAVCLAGEGGVYMPLILRPLSALSFGENGHDAVSPYGYGGPFGAEGSSLLSFLEEVAEWARSRGLASVFGRLSLDDRLRENELSKCAIVVHTGQNVRVDTAPPMDQIRRSYDHKVRKNIKKALGSACVVESSDELDVEDFLRVYTATMDRRNASARYRFTRAFFESLAALPIDTRYYTVRDADGEAISVEVALRSDCSAYSFLGGTLAEAFPVAPNDLLKNEIVREAHDDGRRWFVLGGGYRPDDGIFRYKRSFSREGVVPYFTFRAIGDVETYLRLTRATESEPVHMAGYADELHEEYFPSYRA